MERGPYCPSVLPRTECASFDTESQDEVRHEVRPQGRRKGIHPEGEIGGEVDLPKFFQIELTFHQSPIREMLKPIPDVQIYSSLR